MFSETGNTDSELREHSIEYFKNVESSIDSEEIEDLLASAEDFKKIYIELLERSKSVEEFLIEIKKAASQMAKTFSVDTLQKLVDKPYLIQAFFASRTEGKSGTTPISAEMLSSDGMFNMHAPKTDTGNILRAMICAYVSKDLDPAVRADFIDEFFGLNTIKEGFSPLTFTDPMYSSEVTAEENFKKIQENSRQINDALWHGKEAVSTRLLYEMGNKNKLNKKTVDAWGVMYQTFGNSAAYDLDRFLNRGVGENVIFEVNDESIAERIYLLKNGFIASDGLKNLIVRYFVKTKGLSIEQAKAELESIIKKRVNL